MRCWNYTGLTEVRMQGQHEVLELHRADRGENARTTNEHEVLELHRADGWSWDNVFITKT